MYNWLIALFAGGLAFSALQWLIGDGGVRRTAKLAYGLLFLKLLLEPMLRLLREGAAGLG